jgi:hypothetical protein
VREPSGHLLVFVALVAALLVAVEAEAAIRWTSAGEVAVSAQSVPVHFEMGAGGEKARYFRDFALSANQSSFSGTFKAKAGADTTVKDVVRLVNAGHVERTVTMRADNVSIAHYEVLWWIVRENATTVALFDYRASTPSATLAMPPGRTYTLDLRADLADGAGVHNAGVPLGLRLEVSP